MDKKAFLKVLSGPQEGNNIPLEDSAMVIGRRSGDIIIADPLISSKHAKIFKLDDGWYIEDLHSTNGLTVDGKLTQRTKLTPGVEIVIGNSTMVLFVGSPKKNEPKPLQQQTSPKIELAWLLDEELESDSKAKNLDTIANDLRVPPNFLADTEVVNGLDVGKVFPVSAGTMVIGRLYGEIPLSDPEISRRHALLEIFSRDMIFLRDLGSTNGTYHNGRNIERSKMQTTDTIGLGSSLLKLRVKTKHPHRIRMLYWIPSIAMAVEPNQIVEIVEATKTFRVHRLANNVPSIPHEAYLNAAHGSVSTGLSGQIGWGVGIFEVNIKELYAAINEEESHVGLSPIDYTKILRGAPCSDNRQVLMHLPVPMLSDRWWVTIQGTNPDLRFRSKGVMAELTWNAIDDPVQIQLDDGDKERTKSAVWVTESTGAWLLIRLNDSETLGEYHAWSNPGGYIPSGLAASLSTSGIEATFAAMEKFAKENTEQCDFTWP